MRWMPKTLFGRTLLLIACLIALGQLATALLFRVFVQEPRMVRLAGYTAVQIETSEGLLRAATPNDRARFVERLGRSPGLILSPELPEDARRSPFVPPIAKRFIGELQGQMSEPHEVVWQGAPAMRIWVRMSAGDAGYWLGIPMERLASEMSITWMGVSLAIGVLALVGAWLAQRHLNLPLQRLVAAASRIGDGRGFVPLPEDGPAETAAVSRSFNRMAEDLARAEADRNLLLAGVSHDLRTPLAKMRLSLEMLNPAQDATLISGMQRHIAHIDAILTQFMAFVRGFDHEPMESLDLRVLLFQLAAEYDEAGTSWEVQAPEPAVITARPLALRRALMNLMDNAQRYGQPDFGLRLSKGEGKVVIAVLDRGRGVAPEEREAVMKPFVRLASAEDSGAGTGLGLAIVARIADDHGGSLVLAERSGGGMEVRLALGAKSVVMDEGPNRRPDPARNALSGTSRMPPDPNAGVVRER